MCEECKSPGGDAPRAGGEQQRGGLPLRKVSEFGLPAHPCHHTALKWHGMRAEQGGSRGLGNSRGGRPPLSWSSPLVGSTIAQVAVLCLIEPGTKAGGTSAGILAGPRQDPGAPSNGDPGSSRRVQLHPAQTLYH